MIVFRAHTQGRCGVTPFPGIRSERLPNSNRRKSCHLPILQLQKLRLSEVEGLTQAAQMLGAAPVFKVSRMVPEQ